MQNKDYLNVLENDLCIACGACSFKNSDIQIKLNQLTGLFEPSTKSPVDDFSYLINLHQ